MFRVFYLLKMGAKHLQIRFSRVNLISMQLIIVENICSEGK